MSKFVDKISAYIRVKSVRSGAIKFIVIADVVLILAAFLLGEEAIYNTLPALVSPVLQNPRGYESAFYAAEWVALITPAIALLTAWFAHWRDERLGGRGIKDIITRVVGTNPYNLDTDVIAASMTKQSVLAAIAAALLVVIQIFEPKNKMYGALLKYLSSCGFAFAILFLLVSMICYDYASRFRWPAYHKAQLVRKALILDVLSWYFLLTSFVLTTALISPRLSVLTCIAAGFLMWWYYFFPREGARAVNYSSDNDVKVKDLTESKNFYMDVLGLKAHKLKDGKVTLRARGGAKITLQPESASFDAQHLSFTMTAEDLKVAEEILKQKGVTPKPKLETWSSAGGVETRVVTFKDPHNQHSIELSASAPTRGDDLTARD
ncbi:MAG TPA: VOC family protein [Pyrinomonadaceae bacterium]|nr:VOC family protein [Pyrinomonadaceae bacterium]